jgi:hypothetical protein
MSIELTTRHSINGRDYGPGRVTVPRELALCLLDNEQMFHWSEDYLRSQGSALIGAGNRLIPVSAHYFDSVDLRNVNPAVIASGAR